MRNRVLHGKCAIRGLCSEISRFYGIVIKMFFKPKEHEPSHIHALYGEDVGIFELEEMEMVAGEYTFWLRRFKI